MQGGITLVGVLPEELVGGVHIVTVLVAVPIVTGVGNDDHIVVNVFCAHGIVADDGNEVAAAQIGTGNQRSACLQIFTDKLKSMKKGDIVADHCTGRVGVITSDKPFFCCCSLCIRVDFADSSGVYDCAYFM